MAKATAKKPVKKAATKAKAATKSKTTVKAKPKKAATPKAPPAPPRPATIDWAAVLRSGEDGVKQWNNLTYGMRQSISFKGADLTNADLTMAKLADADLRGADLTGSLLNNIA